jgi:hypothetical protein
MTRFEESMLRTYSSCVRGQLLIASFQVLGTSDPGRIELDNLDLSNAEDSLGVVFGMDLIDPRVLVLYVS